MSERLTMARALVLELADDPETLEELRGLLTTADNERRLTSREAAELLRINVQTLTKLSREGRILGAERFGSRNWRYVRSELAMLPPQPRSLGSTGPGRAVRTPGHSSATRAIRGTEQRAA